MVIPGGAPPPATGALVAGTANWDVVPARGNRIGVVCGNVVMIPLLNGLPTKNLLVSKHKTDHRSRQPRKPIAVQSATGFHARVILIFNRQLLDTTAAGFPV
jgi:hypothetical protein